MLTNSLAGLERAYCELSKVQRCGVALVRLRESAEIELTLTFRMVHAEPSVDLTGAASS